MNEFTHPMLVHFPLALIFVLPFIVIYAIFLEQKEAVRQKEVWYIVTFVTLIVAIFSMLAVYTGEIGEEILEHLIPENPLENHEDLAEFFAKVSYALLGFSVTILFLKQKARKIAKTIFLVINIFSFVLAIRVGNSGGKLVYKYDAAGHLIKHSKLSLAANKVESSKKNNVVDDDDDDD